MQSLMGPALGYSEKHMFNLPSYLSTCLLILVTIISAVPMQEGKKMEGVILYRDPKAMCVEMSFNPNLVKAVKNFKDNKYSEVGHSFSALVVCLFVCLLFCSFVRSFVRSFVHSFILIHSFGQYKTIICTVQFSNGLASLGVHTLSNGIQLIQLY